MGNLKITDFTQHLDVQNLLQELKLEKIHEKVFSDVMDTDGNQYVELVQEGGGVLGVALLGYTFVLEQMGLRFFSLAGTSAGSINAMMLAGQGDVSGEKSEKIIDALVNKNLFDFVDGDKHSKRLIEAILSNKGKFILVYRVLRVIKTLFGDLGLNPGKDFLNWLIEYLDEGEKFTLARLEDTFGKVPGNLVIREGVDKTTEGLKPRLAIITADLTTETKVEFPKMASLYWEDPAIIHPAKYVRASMSIPYFFEPFTIDKIPQGEEAARRWETMVSFRGKLPKKAYFVDGGVMSNFPIDVFHKKNSVPRLPTFGVRLGIDRDQANTISSPFNLFGAMFNSLRHLHDYDFILKNPDYSRLIAKIDIGKHNWLNFNISDEAKLDLFVRGARTAASFLKKFDWPQYKEIRESLVVSRR
jgi:NTE family protein